MMANPHVERSAKRRRRSVPAVLRRRGLARAVLEFALKLAWSRGCYKVILLSGVQRSEAHKLYESIGFRGDVERGFVAKPSNAV